MQSQRNTALLLLLVLSAYIFFTWSSDKNSLSQQNQPVATVVNSTNASGTTSSSQNLVSVNTDLFDIAIDLNGGDIVKADLKDQKQNLDSDENFHLLQQSNDFVYTASSDVLLDTVDSRIRIRPVYTSAQSSYVLADGAKNLTVTLTGEDNGKKLKIEKIFTFTRDSHSIEVKYNVTALTEPVKISMISSLKQSVENPALKSGMFGTSAYRGTAYHTADTKYSKESMADVASGSLTNVISAKGGWISMIQHYFVSAWIGTNDKANTIQMTGLDGGTTAVISIMQSKANDVAVNQSTSISNVLWIGPKNQEEMATAGENLDLTVDYGWLSFLSVGLYKVLALIHFTLNWLGIANWGLAIIILTILVRTIMFPLTHKQYVSMAKMRLLTPKINEIKEKYKDDRQKLGVEMMNLYKKENANPLGGCLPILIQMPIFIALYWTLMESTELRHQPFMLWIRDLSVYDPYFVLPILMGVSMFFIQKLSPTPITDPMQKKIMTIMPIVFTAMFCTFPAGLTLYWLVSNTFSIVQQIIIFRSLEKKGLSMKKAVKPTTGK